MNKTRVVHAVFAAVFLAVPAGLAILVDAPAVIAHQMQKPGNPELPPGDGCVPIGVTKSPSTGIVYADEDCHGKIYRSRMN